MNRQEMERLIDGVTVIAEKVRVLHMAGATRSEIAAFLGIKYQHVHNVLKRGGLLGTPAVAPRGLAQSGVQVHTLVVEPGGKVTLPSGYIGSQGIGEGDVLICREEDGGLRIMSRAAAVDALRDLARQRMPAEAALLDALLAIDRKPD